MMYPHLDDFASMLEALFVGPCQPLQRPMRCTEPGWDLSELRFAVQRLKTGKCGDELGLTAELLKHAPEEFLNTLLTLYNNVLVTGEGPESWCRTLFSMLPKKKSHYNLRTSDQLQTFFFFFSAPFSRRRSLVDDCFTGQPPGSAISIPAAPDVHDGLGQIQASAPKGRAGRRLYKTFAYLLLGRLEQFLEAGQPEEQHGFRPRTTTRRTPCHS